MKFIYSKIIYLHSFICLGISISFLIIFLLNFFRGFIAYFKTGTFYYYRASDYWGYTSDSIIGFDNTINWIFDINLLVLSPIIFVISIVINPRVDYFYAKEKK